MSSLPPPEIARRVEDIHSTMKLGPLVEDAEFDAFYFEGINATRGPDRIAHIARELRRATRTQPFTHAKLFLLGHAGVGKSTELTRLGRLVADIFDPIRVQAVDLNPETFRPHDVLLLMLAELTKRVSALVEAGQLESDRLPQRLLQDVLEWFDKEEAAVTEKTDLAAKVEAGVGAGEKSLFSIVTGLFARATAEAKVGVTRESKRVQYRVHRLVDLIDLANRLLIACRDFRRALCPPDQPREWLFIVEDLEKAGFSPDALRELFSTYANVLTDLQAHFIFVLPIELYYSDVLCNRPFILNHAKNILDTPVHRPDHTPHEPGRRAVLDLLAKRVDPGLFEDGQAERLVIASGGNLRDLFTLVSHAAEFALDDSASRIAAGAVDRAIEEHRRLYSNHLYSNPHDKEPVLFADKVALLVAIYEGKRDHERDRVFHALLRARALQEFDEPHGFGVHPLVVDILHEIGHIHVGRPGKPPGGTT